MLQQSLTPCKEEHNCCHNQACAESGAQMVSNASNIMVDEKDIQE